MNMADSTGLPAEMMMVWALIVSPCTWKVTSDNVWSSSSQERWFKTFLSPSLRLEQEWRLIRISKLGWDALVQWLVGQTVLHNLAALLHLNEAFHDHTWFNLVGVIITTDWLFAVKLGLKKIVGSISSFSSFILTAVENKFENSISSCFDR